ncbi:MAG TPA: SCO family protein [Salinisphaeraceae bacterium]|nr:SCO family protein [Salinisphaeraceae bacterium]
MNTPRLPRFSRISLCLFALSLLALAGCSSDVSYNAHDIAGVMPDMSFELTNEDGNRVDETAYADDRLTLMFFGYTHCPDICPMTLARLKAAMASLDEDVRNNMNVLFVSVDPERDTPERLKQYTQHFGPQFVGLTGTQKQLTKLTKTMRITYSYSEPDENGFYLVNHSSAVFVFDDEGKVRLLINQDETVDQISEDLQTLLEQTA